MWKNQQKHKLFSRRITKPSIVQTIFWGNLHQQSRLLLRKSLSCYLFASIKNMVCFYDFPIHPYYMHKSTWNFAGSQKAIRNISKTCTSLGKYHAHLIYGSRISKLERWYGRYRNLRLSNVMTNYNCDEDFYGGSIFICTCVKRAVTVNKIGCASLNK